MPRNGIPEFFHPEIRHLIELALADAWQEIKDDSFADAQSVKARLTTTIVALAAIGETDPSKLKTFALHAAKSSFRTRKRLLGGRQGGQIAA